MYMSLNCIENIIKCFKHNTKLYLHKYLYKRPLHLKEYTKYKEHKNHLYKSFNKSKQIGNKQIFNSEITES